MSYKVGEVADMVGTSVRTLHHYDQIGLLKPESLSAVGYRLYNDNDLEILQQNSLRQELARQIAADLTLPDIGESMTVKAQVQVPVEMDIVKADQQQVDGGHSPWQLDPLSVALTFANLQVSPEGINGEPKIPESSFSVAVNNGIGAIVKVTSGPVKNIYLKRLIRHDETGIWSVVGYDPR